MKANAIENVPSSIDSTCAKSMTLAATIITANKRAMIDTVVSQHESSYPNRQFPPCFTISL
jgi:hypothetical protein